MNRRCLFIQTWYESFLNGLYHDKKEIGALSYSQQIEQLIATRFGDSDFYSRNLAAHGWETADLVVNCEPLQRAWAKENNREYQAFEIMIDQIRAYAPDVLYVHNIELCDARFFDAVQGFVSCVVGQTAYPLVQGTVIGNFNLLFSSLPNYVTLFRSKGLCAHYQPLAFEPLVLNELRSHERDMPLTFIGGTSPYHFSATELLTLLADSTDIIFMGYGAESLPVESPIRKRHRGERWGLDMFQSLCRSKITVNRHIDIAQGNANNMRLFEATGCGCLLLTENAPNLPDLFEPGREVLTYDSPEQCLKMAQYALSHPDEVIDIARAGHQRTIQEHTYTARMAQTAEILERFLHYRHLNRYYSIPDDISGGYKDIEAADVTEKLTSAWKDPSIPAQQRGLAQADLAAMYKGDTPRVYAVISECLSPILHNGDALLEIGCASGYYAEVIEYLSGKRVRYTGADYSTALIRMACDIYPARQFVVTDGADLPFPNDYFDVVISSGMLLHVSNYRRHIEETARCAREWIVAHRTPLRRKAPTKYMSKRAYGVETLELAFNELELLTLFREHDYELFDQVVYASDKSRDMYECSLVLRRQAW